QFGDASGDGTRATAEPGGDRFAPGNHADLRRPDAFREQRQRRGLRRNGGRRREGLEQLALPTHRRERERGPGPQRTAASRQIGAGWRDRGYERLRRAPRPPPSSTI